MTNYKNIEFGEISAEIENDLHPELIQNGYYDYKDTINKLLYNHQFLVLGGKGSGKSLIGQKLQTYESDNAHFVSLKDLCKFPYKTFKKIYPGSDRNNGKYSISWEWILTICALESFMRDRGVNSEFNSDFEKSIEILKRSGLLSPNSLRDIVNISSNKSFKLDFDFKFVKFGMSSAASSLSQSPSIETYITSLKTVLFQCKGDNLHYVVIDGLDDVLSDQNDQFSVIMELIKSAQTFNAEMKKNNVLIKTIVLCRTDIFDRLKDPNKNKISDTYAIKLDWYQDQESPENLELVKLINQRTSLVGVNDVFEQFFLKTINGKDVRKYLLENTRYIPRDLIKLLTYLKNVYRTEKFTPAQIDEAVKVYSQEYFWKEIEDELAGYVENRKILELKKILCGLGKKEFMLYELEEKVDEHMSLQKSDFPKILEILYDCGAISLLLSQDRFQSKWKKNGEFDVRQKMALHRATYKALNIL